MTGRPLTFYERVYAMVRRIPRGRVATARAYDYFGLNAPAKDRLW